MKYLLTGALMIIALGFLSPVRAQSFLIENNALTLPSPIEFNTGSAELKPSSTAALEHIQAYLSSKTYISLVRIEGHAPGQALSEARAVAVAAWLVAHGIDCKRLLPVGFGESKPVADGRSAEGRAANTRIMVVNAELRGHKIGGMPSDGGGVVAGDPCGN